MALTTVSVLAATAVLGNDLLANRPDVASSQRPRVIRGLSLTGSAAIGDSRVQVKVGANTVATLYNTATGFPTQDASTFNTQYHVAAGAPISVIVDDAPATNPLNLLIDV